MRKNDIDINPYKESSSLSPLHYYDISDDRILLSGFAFNNGKTLCRLPEKSLDVFNEEIRERSFCTSGGVLEFVTNSPVIGVKVALRNAFWRPFMTLAACRGLDFYTGKSPRTEYFATAMPKGLETEYEFILPAVKKETRCWSVCLPIFAGIERLSIGIDPDAALFAQDVSGKKRVVFYGSSITQGICASRPGNTYVNMLGRKLNIEAVNLGFAGNARGEPEMAEIIAGIRMDAFVMDYDHNSPSASHLEETHERFFRIIRGRNPSLPILIVTKPDFDTDRPNSSQRRDMIRKTFERAKNAGDQNVYFIDGETLFGRNGRDCCTADNCHPNDLGFYRMAEHLAPTLRKALTSQL